MRTLSDIKEEIKVAEDTIQELEDEIKWYQSKCPHPPHFVTKKLEDMEDDCLGPGIYEYTTVTYTCALCEGKFYGKYDKRPDPGSFGEKKPPKLEDLV